MIRKWIKKIVNTEIDDRLMDGIDYDQLSEKLSEMPDLAQELSEHFDTDDTLSQVADNIDLYDLAGRIDTHDVAYHMDACDIAGELDLSDIAYELEERIQFENIEDALLNKLLGQDVHRKVAELLWDRNESEIMDYTLDNFEFDYDNYVVDSETLADAIVALDGRIDVITTAFEDCFDVIKNLTNREE
jgi:hypothetical protein